MVKATQESQAKVQEWVAVVARCFQLQDALGVLELDRVLDAAPDDLDRHRLGLQVARENRVKLIARTTAGLVDRMNAASSRANAKVLLNPFDSPSVVRSSNAVVAAGGVVTAKRIGAVGLGRATEAKGRALEAGAEGFARAQGATSKVLGGIAERARRRRGAVGDDDTDG